MAEVMREGLYWDQFDRGEQKLLRHAGFDPTEADAFGAVDGELALLRVLTLRLVKSNEEGKTDPKRAEAIARLVERVGRVLRARHALKDDQGQDDRLEKISTRVLEDERARVRKEVAR